MLGPEGPHVTIEGFDGKTHGQIPGLTAYPFGGYQGGIVLGGTSSFNLTGSTEALLAGQMTGASGVVEYHARNRGNGRIGETHGTDAHRGRDPIRALDCTAGV